MDFVQGVVEKALQQLHRHLIEDVGEVFVPGHPLAGVGALRAVGVVEIGIDLQRSGRIEDAADHVVLRAHCPRQLPGILRVGDFDLAAFHLTTQGSFVHRAQVSGAVEDVTHQLGHTFRQVTELVATAPRWRA